jgi:hypothetical protein
MNIFNFPFLLELYKFFNPDISAPAEMLFFYLQHIRFFILFILDYYYLNWSIQDFYPKIQDAVLLKICRDYKSKNFKSNNTSDKDCLT